MKHEIIELHDVQMIGMAKKIAFNEAKEECPRFSNHNCATCWEANFGACKNNTFTYVIGGIYKGGDVPEGMLKEWLPAHPEYKWVLNSCCMEWYLGTDIQSPDYQCGVMMPLED